MADMLAIAAAAAWLLAFGWCAAATGRPALRAGTADPGQTAYWAHSLSRQDRLTSHGSALGAWAGRAAADMTAAGGAPGLAPPFWPAELTRVTCAVAAGVPVQVPGVTPGMMTGVRPCRRRAGARTGIPGQFAGTARPAAAWSSFGGKWRMVRIGPPPSRRMHPALWLVLAAWLALMAYVSSLLPGLAGVLLPAALAAASAATVLAGARGLAAWLARPAETSFQAQVIARWVEHRGANDDDASITCVAVDDGERSWSFDVSGAAFGQLALGDTVAVRASPRSGKLLRLIPGQNGLSGRTTAPGGTGLGARDETTLRRAAVTRPPAVAAAEAPPGVAAAEAPPGVAAERPPGEAVGEGPPGEAAAAEAWPGMAAGGRMGAAPRGTLLAADEVSAAVGRPVRVTPLTARRASAVYRGEGVTVIVTVAEGFLGGLTSLARRRGRPLPGAGDEAWLLNRGRTVVMRVGGMTAKLTLGGSAARSLPPQVLAQLAATVGERLAHHVASPGTPTSTSCRD
jgi:hypothetical protein